MNTLVQTSDESMLFVKVQRGPKKIADVSYLYSLQEEAQTVGSHYSGQWTLMMLAWSKREGQQLL